MENYFIVRGDVVGLSHKYGMCLYVKENIKFVEVSVGCPNAAAVCLIDYDLWILSVYRPPSYSVHENEVLDRVILSFCEGREVVVFGDFNLPSLLWSAGGGAYGAVGNVDRKFLDCFIAAGLTQWVMEATFIASGNTLNLFFTSEIDREGDVRILAPFPRCNHSLIVCEYLFSFDIDADEHIVKERYLWHKGDYDSLSCALLRGDWESELMHLAADAAYVFLQILSNLVNVYIPQYSRLH